MAFTVIFMKRVALIFASTLFALAMQAAARADSTVVFNELQYHPAGNEAQLEWVELYNQMAVDMDISGWYFGDGIDFLFPEGTIVPGGGFLVVSASPAALEADTGFSGALGPFAGRLDNGGEKVELRNNSGRLMDSLRYNDAGSWPIGADGSGVTLAKLHPNLASAPAASWTVSARVGGTPGAHNFPVAGVIGGAPPELISYWSLDQSSGSMTDTAGGNNGTLGSGVTRVPGLVGALAVSFNNTTSAFVSVGNGTGNSFSTTEGITVEALIRPEWSAALNDQDQIFRKEDGNNRILFSFQNDGNTNGFSLPPVGAGPVLSFGLNVGGVYSELDMLLDGQAGRPTLAQLKDGAAHHVAATFDAASGIKAIYVDGALAFSTSLAAGSLITSGGGTTAYIGNMSGRAEPFTGVIDEVAIWKKSLGAAELLRHAQKAAEGKSYFEVEDSPESAAPPVRFNEFFAPLGGGGWIELNNMGATAIPLGGYVLATAGIAAAYVFSPTSLPAGGNLTVSAAQLGFELSPGLALFLLTPDRDSVVDAVRLQEGLRGRLPDGSGPWLHPDRATPGAFNAVTLRDGVVINEILYHHRPQMVGQTSVESPEAWIELFNRGGSTVDLSGWTLSGGIDFAFVAGTSLAAGQYLVVAQEKEQLQALYPSIRIVGNFSRRLSKGGDRIRLLDERGNSADEVEYYDRGRWPEAADGGGSSLELRDPDADNSVAEAWAASDESGRSAWQSYSYRMTAAANVGPTRWNELVIGLLDDGEALLDDISVVESPGTNPKELLQNGSFSTGASKWRMLGNHDHSSVVTPPDNPGGPALHLVARGATEHMHNHLETTYAGNAVVVNGREYEVSFRAKWLSGSNRLSTRLYFNRCPAQTLLEVPVLSGTPGARNSAFAGNIGPTYRGFIHAPAVPKPTEAVTVTVTAEDSDSVSGCVLWYSVSGAAWVSTAMVSGGRGLYEGTIPPQASSSVVQFYVEGTDGLGVKSTFPAAGRDSRALYKVDDGQAQLGRVHNLRIVMTKADADFMHLPTNVMSNDRLGCTVIYDESEVFYEAGIHIKGSERGRNVSGRVGFSFRLDPERRLRGVHDSFQIDRSGGWKFGGSPGQDEIVVKHVALHAGGIPSMYDDLVRVIAPRTAHTGSALLIMAAYNEVFLDSQYPDGGAGDTFKLELIYSPTSTVDGNRESLKLPEPDDVQGTDFRDLGNDKEVYRWTFLKENHRTEDDYSRLIALCKAFGLPNGSLEAGTRDIMDSDQWMRAFVLYSLCGITDAYTRGNNHNFMVYFPPFGGPAQAFPWDLDFAWVQSPNAPLWGDQNLGRITQLTPNRRLFYGHLLDVIGSTFNTGYMARWTEHYGGLAGQSYAAILSFIGQRASFVLGSLPARVSFAVTTNGGASLDVDTPTVQIEGNAWIDVYSLFVINGSGEPLELDPTWSTQTRWQVTVPLDRGANPLTFVGLDYQGNVAGTDDLVVTTSVGSVPPALSSVSPAFSPPGGVVTLRGNGFQAGVRVFFGGVESTGVSYQPGVDPASLTATVPALSDGRVSLSVRNPDGRVSNALSFTVGSTPVFVRGDVDLSGSLDLADAIRLLFYLYRGGIIPCLDAADASNNEALDLADVIFLLNYLYRGGSAPEAPFPRSGQDTGKDGPLDCQRGI